MARPLRLAVNLPTTTDAAYHPQPPIGGAFRLRHNLPSLTIVTATKVIGTANPSGVSATAPFSLTVNATDLANVVAVLYTGSATVTKASGPGMLSGTTTASFFGGVLTFSNLLLSSAGTYTLIISSGSLTPATTASFTVSPIAFTDPFSVTSANLNGANWSYVAGGPMTQSGSAAVGAGAGGSNFSLAEHDYGVTDGTIATTAIATAGNSVGGNEANLVRSIAGSGQTASYIGYGGGETDTYPGLNTQGESGTSSHVQRSIIWPTGASNAYKLSRISGGSGSQRYVGQRDGLINTVMTLQAALNAADTHAGIQALDTKTIGPVTIDGSLPTTVPAPTSATPPIFVVDGNSLSAVGFSVTDAQGWFTQVIPALITAGYDVVSMAISGQTTEQMYTNVAAIDQHYNAGRSDHICFIWEGTNSLANSACDSAAGIAIWQDMVQLHLYRRAAGFRAPGGTIIARTGVIFASNISGFATQSGNINGWMRQYGRYFCDGLADFASDPALSSVTGTYYNADNVHLLAAGQARLVPTINGVLAATKPAFGPASNIAIAPPANYIRCIFDLPIFVQASGNFQPYFRANTTAFYFQYKTLDTAVSAPNIQVFDVTAGGSYLGNMSTASGGYDTTGITITPGHAYHFVVYGFDAGAGHSVQMQFFEKDTSPGGAARIGFIQQPYSGAHGTAFPQQPLLAAVDANGNTDTSYTGSVTLSIVSGTGTGGAALTGTVTINFVAGVATYSGVALNTAGDNYQLRAHSGSLADAISGPIFVS